MMLRAKRFGARGLLALGSGWVLVGCGGAATGEPGKEGPTPDVGSAPGSLVLAASGTRLIAHAYESEGAIRFRHFEDSQLGTECAFANDENGSVRCLPSTAVRLVYLDAACSGEPATWNGWPPNAPMAVGAWVVDAVGAACEGELPTHRAFRLGEEAYPETSNTPSVYELIDGTCQPARLLAKANPAVHRLVPQPPELFVAGRIASTPSRAKLNVRQIVAGDGARLNLDVTTRAGEPCALQPDGVCVPAPLGVPGGAMVDADCETSGYYAPDAACPAPRYAVSAWGRVLELRQADRLYSRNIVFPVPENVADLQYACEETAPMPGVWAGGADRTGTFESVEAIGLGHGALRASAFRLEGEQTEFTLSDGQDPRIFQTTRGTCHVVMMGDGREHCLDDAPSPPYSGYFADAGCSTNLYEVNEGDADEMLAAHYEDTYRVKAVYSLVPHRGEVYRSDGLACIRLTSAPELFAGKLLPDSAFPLVEQVRLVGSP